MKTQGDPVSRVIGPDNLKDIAAARRDIPADKCVHLLHLCCIALHSLICFSCLYAALFMSFRFFLVNCAFARMAFDVL